MFFGKACPARQWPVTPPQPEGGIRMCSVGGPPLRHRDPHGQKHLKVTPIVTKASQEMLRGLTYDPQHGSESVCRVSSGRAPHPAGPRAPLQGGPHTPQDRGLRAAGGPPFSPHGRPVAVSREGRPCLVTTPPHPSAFSNSGLVTWESVGPSTGTFLPCQGKMRVRIPTHSLSLSPLLHTLICCVTVSPHVARGAWQVRDFPGFWG